MSSGSSAMGLCDEGVWPPGFRFHPTDEELVLYYLKFKICRRKLKLNIIRETDVYKWDPEELPGQSLLNTGDRQWFFFTPRERRYPNGGTRFSRATRHGYWKATGKDRIIKHNSRNVGVKKTLVFYQGRAPNGERTDWVMHEYTLDDNELKRCKNLKDCYALYKLFKKSGPGPKNGEQYGALFREEDWADDVCQNFNDSDGQETQGKVLDEVTSVVQERENVLMASDHDEFMRLIANDPLLQLPWVDGYCQSDSALQVDDKEETVSNVADDHCLGHILPDADKVFHLNGQPGDLHASFDFAQSGISQLQPYEGDITSTPKLCEDSDMLQEQDFLEIDDLIDPEPTASSANENFSGHVLPVELDGLSELDLFHDADMFLRDLGPIIHATGPDPYLDARDIDVADNSNETEFAFTLSESRPLTQPTLGLGYESINSAAARTSENQQAATNEGGSASWFSSNLWAFVDSIPTTPASASENVNRAFERMSSFSRLRLNTLNSNVSVGNHDTGARRSSGMNKGFFLFTILGVLCAILWAWIGNNVRLWGRGIAL